MPNDGDCFIVFETDEDATKHNATSKKTYTNGDWADAESGGGGGGGADFPTFTITVENYSGDETPTTTYSCDKTYAECLAMCENSPCVSKVWLGVSILKMNGEEESYDTYFAPYTEVVESDDIAIRWFTEGGVIFYHSDGTIDESARGGK